MVLIVSGCSGYPPPVRLICEVSALSASDSWLRPESQRVFRGRVLIVPNLFPTKGLAMTHHTELTDLIASDHQQLEELFGQLESGDGDRRQLVDKVIDELTAHTAAEEQVVYPALRDMVPDGRSMADRALSEHKGMKEAMSKLKQGQPGDTQFETALRNLMAEVRSHVPEEENELLPGLRMVIGADKMVELGDVFTQVKGTISTHSSA